MPPLKGSILPGLLAIQLHRNCIEKGKLQKGKRCLDDVLNTFKDQMMPSFWKDFSSRQIQF